MKTSLKIAFAAGLFYGLFSVAGCSGPEQVRTVAPVRPPVVGGPCTYSYGQGYFQVVQVLPAPPAASEVLFVFHPSSAIGPMYGDVNVSGSFGADAPAVGQVFAGMRGVETSGTCLPLNYVVTIGGKRRELMAGH